ncbi:penicillin-binding transpeptidase domain-containing protein [Peredibacter sp. HCB2-198]|uniref:penicillin-binding transpeptidase domain-containing protein n=1 Tax=Peredibacter sp. HCB2-198 TaxID=3383025 RepID=UPI0038B4DA95
MKIILFIILSLILSCSTKRDFPGKDVCYLLYDVKTQRYVEEHNRGRCEMRLPACSTFKVPLAVMAFDSGVLKDENLPVFKWDGQKRMIEAWNQDQTPTTWMRESAVWVSQEITPKLGIKKIEQYLKDFKYGNHDMSGGLKYAWLTPAPFIADSMGNTLKVSAHEQVSFLEKLWQGELKASSQSQILTQKIMAQDTSPRGYTLVGKTGSGFADSHHDLRLGWYIGHLEKDDREYIVVLNFSDKQKVPAGTYAGREAKEMAINLLSERKLW